MILRSVKENNLLFFEIRQELNFEALSRFRISYTKQFLYSSFIANQIAVDNGVTMKKNMEGCLDFTTPISNTVGAGKSAVTACSRSEAEKVNRKYYFLIHFTHDICVF